MAFVIADRVRETSTTTGTGNFTLAGAVDRFRTFDSVLDTGDTTYYTIADQSGVGWEVGIATFTSPSTLARTTILSSSNGGSAVDFGAGSKDVFISLPASKTNTVEAGNLTFASTAQRITGDFSNGTVVNRVAFQTSTTNGVTTVFAIPNGTGTVAQFAAVNNSDPTNASLMQLAVLSGESSLRAGINGTGTYLPMTLYTGGSERMRLDTSGNLGIGTSSPGVRLDIKGMARSSIGTGTGAGGAGYAFYQFGTSATATENWHIGAEGDGSFRFYNQGFGAGIERLRINSSGNVGIGTTSPDALLTVNTVASFGAGAVGAPSIAAKGDLNTGIYFSAADTLDFSTAGTQRGQFDSSGNFKFNSGYGSVATAYGCRAWVNFNGTGTVAIRGSGNVTSITDNGTGDYTVNFTNAMPDANYSISGATSRTNYCFVINDATAPAVGSVRIGIYDASTAGLTDRAYVCVNIHR